MYESKDDERCAKRQKVEDDDVSDEGSEQNDEYWANERIFINFPELGDESSYHPEYTHQLFDDERMDFLSEEELGMEVNIDVCLRDWSMKVSIAGLSSNLTKSMLLDGLRNGLPVDVVIAGDRNPISKEQIPSPVGKKVRSFTRNGKSFSIYSARHKDAGAATLLQRGEKLAMYYIETADSVDFGDDRWEVLFLYENNSYVIGYLTIFTFHNPYGDVLRICQCLVLPCRQGLGLGAELVRQVYLLAGRRKGVAEVTVEDPCPAFCVLRDNVDLAWTEECGAGDGDVEVKFLTKEQKEVMEEMRSMATMCNDIVAHICKKKTREGKLGLLLREEGKKVDRAEVYSLLIKAVQNHPDFVSFRLSVKKTMFKQDADGSLHIMSATERKNKLEDLFAERLERYRRMMKTAQRLGLLKLPSHVV